MSFGVVFDIDGVLLRGSRRLTGARWAIQVLEKLNIPYALLTNGGGVLEEKKKASVMATLQLPEMKGPVILAHTPMKSSLAQEFRNKRVLILGCKEEMMVAKQYGFTRTVTPQTLVSQHPLAYAGWGRQIAATHEDSFALDPIEAIVIMHDPVDYHLELQVCLDVLRQRYPCQNPLAPPCKIFNSNEDLEFSSPFPYPRLAQGTFLHCLELMHNKVKGALGPLEIVRFGKPNLVTFHYCQTQLPTATRFHMIGDNPAADIRGANLAGWTSHLVLSGMTKENSPTDPAHFVHAHVGQAVQAILKQEGFNVDTLPPLDDDQV